MARLSLVEVMNLRSMMRNKYIRQESTFKYLSHFIAPQRLLMNPDDQSSKQWKTRAIIKNQGGRALRTFTSGMQHGATPQSRQWFGMGVANNAKNNLTVVRKHFAQREGILNNHFQISNLYRVLPIAYKDVGVFSTAAYGMLPHARFGFYFYPYTMGTYGFSCDVEGNPNMFYRDVAMTVKQVIDEYATIGKDGSVNYHGIPNWVVEQYKASRYLEIVIISQVIIANAHYWPEKAKRSFDPSDKKFVCYTYVHSYGGNLPMQASNGFRNEIHKKAAQEPTTDFIKVTGYNYFPVIIPRWEVQADGVWGCDGPGDIALGDIMTLNEMEKARLEGVGKLVRPPMVGPASLKRHQASILAGGITYVDDAGSQHGFKPAFEMDPKLYELIQCESEYALAIDEAFYVDLFRQFSRGESKTHVSVEEIREKSAEKMAMVAPAVAQLDHDQGSKLISNGQIILEEQGKMPPMPREIQGENVTIEYKSILAQAAKAGQMNSVERAANFITTFAGAVNQPEIIQIIDAEAYARKYLEYVGIEPELIRDEDEVDQIRKAIRRDQAQQKQMATEAQAASTAKDLSQAQPIQGSMLDNYLQASNA
jgi:hypothetical protein